MIEEMLMHIEPLFGKEVKDIENMYYDDTTKYIDPTSIKLKLGNDFSEEWDELYLN